MPYRRSVQIEFNHCDPAGIVFYPRYLEFANSIAENFFAEILGRSYAAIIAEGDGVPTVRLDCSFRSPSRLGETLEVTLAVTGVGRSSVDFCITAQVPGEAEPRLTINKRLVFIDGPAMKSKPWPDDLRARLDAALKEDSA